MANTMDKIAKNWPFSHEQVLLFLAEQYNLHGTLKQLVGEIDLNLLIRSEEGSYLVKISPPSREIAWLQQQDAILHHLLQKGISTSQSIANISNSFITPFIVDQQIYQVRVLSWIEGKPMAHQHHYSSSLFQELGTEVAKMTNALLDFTSSYFTKHDWDSNQVLWVFEYQHLLDPSLQEPFIFFEQLIRNNISTIQSLRKSFIHNDINDHNIIVHPGHERWQISSIIDWGDTIHTSSIHDLAIACSYALTYSVNPIETLREIVRGYHGIRPLQQIEIEQLYTCISIRILISLVKSSINKHEHPTNQYHQVSHDDMKKLIMDWYALDHQLLTAYLLFDCDYKIWDTDHLKKWMQHQAVSLRDMFPQCEWDRLYALDLGLMNAKMGHMETLNDPAAFQQKLKVVQTRHPNTLILGGYLEIRGIYQHQMYQYPTNSGYSHRTQHLGVDFWLPSFTAIHSPFDGEVLFFGDNGQAKDYGYTLICRHKADDSYFYLLYGHLKETTFVQTGDRIKKGQQIAQIGDESENGGWCPHLHFQIIGDMLDQTTTFYGVCDPADETFWSHICPDPSWIFKEYIPHPTIKWNRSDLITKRNHILGKSLSLQYQDPLYIQRGDGMYLIDEKGQRYIDTINNVAHVGHENSAVVNAGIAQMTLLNTNTRYIHHMILDYANALLQTHDDHLEVAYFVNSGSEANELAIRMAKQMTGSNHFIVVQHGYHGNTNATISISSYKFDGKGGKGADDTIHVLPLPDPFRGKYTGKDTCDLYLYELKTILDQLQSKGIKPAALIIEPIISCGGQIVLPSDFLKMSFNMIREYGGLAIADEVQVGLGRMGSHWWAYQKQDAYPDIVTMGKPLGNGHPIGAVVCRQEVADSFSNGMEFFNTFGGNPVSCAIGLAVIKQIQDQNLIENARIQGTYFTNKLIKLATRFPIIADVRGVGLFLGFELCDRNNQPLEKAATTLVNEMKKRKVLMSTDGPDHNVIKIKPPIIIQQNHIDYIIAQLEIVLSNPIFII